MALGTTLPALFWIWIFILPLFPIDPTMGVDRSVMTSDGLSQLTGFANR